MRFRAGLTLFAYPHISASGNAAAAARSVASSESWLHIVSALELINFVLDVPLALIFYVLLAPVDRNIALLTAFFRLGNAFLGGIIGLARVAVLNLFAEPGYRHAFTPDQSQALAALFLSLHAYGFDICLVFFGIHCVLLGLLIYRSGYLPRFLGVLLALAGTIYLVDSLADIALPALADAIPNAIFLIGFASELALCLWLIIKGVDVRGWEARIQATTL